MAERFDLLLRGGTCLLPGGETPADVGVRAGRIAAVGDLSRASAAEILEIPGLHVLPGVIDSQVHFREPGLTHKEDLATGTAAAALGGVTAIFEMPNTTPPTTTAEDLAEKLRLAQGRAWVDHAFFVGAARENTPDLAALERLPGCSGVKIFMGSSTGSLLVEDDADVREVLRHGRRRVAVHCEDEARLKERRAIADAAGSPVAHPRWRDATSALRATQRLLALAAETGRPVHVLHVTTAEEMALLARNKHLATVEATPQHLTLSAPDCYERLGTFAQMNPPIREEEHRQALWRALQDGVVDVIGSDHAPHTREEKARPYPASPSGMPGVQTLLPLMLDHVAAGRLPLRQLVDLTSAGPARIYKIRGKGAIVEGNDADFSIVDLRAERTITNEWIASRCGWTPFDGVKVKGWPKYTIIRGNVVMREDELQGSPLGRPVEFEA